MSEQNAQTKKGKVFRIIMITLLVILVAFTLTVVISGEMMMNNMPANGDTFYQGTKINNIDISGKTKDEASTMIKEAYAQEKNEIKITVIYKDKEWLIEGKTLNIENGYYDVINTAFNFGRTGPAHKRVRLINKIKNQGYNVRIPYKLVINGFKKELEKIKTDVERDPKDATINFSPDTTQFETVEGEVGVKVKEIEFYDSIYNCLEDNKVFSIHLPVEHIKPEISEDYLKNNIKLRGEFYTSYSSSIPSRKHNIKLALSKFNGMKVEPGIEVSFNQTTGVRNKANGYKKANIISNGQLVEGVGGGVCQASTTLYNALVCSDVEILEAQKHSMPVSYVALAFDAMVAHGISDLKFRNNLDTPIFIKAWGDDNKAYVQIYGKPFENGISIERRTEFVKVLPHNGDMIVRDNNGEYSNKVNYKGEYLRLRYPKQGYECKSYIDYYSGGELVESKLLRHEKYLPLQGIIIEGTDELGEGMTLPPNSVKKIGPQVKVDNDLGKAKAKITKNNPSKYNP